MLVWERDTSYDSFQYSISSEKSGNHWIYTVTASGLLGAENGSVRLLDELG